MIHLGEITPDTLPFSLNKQTYNKQHCETTHLKTKDGESVNYTNWNNYFAQTITLKTTFFNKIKIKEDKNNRFERHFLERIQGCISTPFGLLMILGNGNFS